MHVKTSGGLVLFVGKWVEWGVGLFLSFQGRPMAFGNALAMVELALQLQLPATATARPDPSCICDLHHSSGNAGSPAHWVGPGLEPANSWFLVGFINH